jgi:23S rRNA pseudouridine2605 synthase
LWFITVEKTANPTTMNHDKFTKKKNSAIKEGFKSAKKKAKKEKAAAIDKRFEDKRQQRAAMFAEAERQASGKTSPAAKKAPDGKEKSERPEPRFNNEPLTSKPAKDKKPEFKRRSGEKVFNTAKAAARPTPKKGPAASDKPKVEGRPGEMPLNKYLAHCGVTSRRDAVSVIKEGKVKVNDAVILEPAFKVIDKDAVTYNGKRLYVSKNMVYILLNKPKDYITTTDDPQGRKTVLQLTKMATNERIYPVGRLDRNTSGVLLLTNDGELTQKLSHPSYNITKVYEAKLDKPLTKAHFDAILSGLKLEDGEIKADTLAYADAHDKSVIGIEIHSGRNRIVRRIFEHLGYDVKGLDRVMYATLTKKNVERGKWRFLSEKEVRLLKYLNKSKGQVSTND